MKTIILIDGQNLFYDLKDLGLKEKDIKWDILFKSMIEPGDSLLRTYWFRAQKLLDAHFTHQNIKSRIIQKKYNSHYNAYKKDPASLPALIAGEIALEVKKVEDWLRSEKIKFDQIEYNYDKLCLEFGDIEFVKTGVVKINPFDQTYVGEKGVDISLAVKMIALSVENKCDKIILVSGDFDYAEAIKYVKNNMTKIHIVKIHKGIPPKNKSMSRDLAILADKVIDIYESDLKSHFSKLPT
jgi:uncharacterized LabA/DUF88 family protein